MCHIEDTVYCGMGRYPGSGFRVTQYTGALNSYSDIAMLTMCQLSEMLSRNLREDRHPLHAAEVRENLILSVLVNF